MRSLDEKLKQYRRDFAVRQAAREGLPRWVAFATLFIIVSCLVSVFLSLYYPCVLLHERFHPGTLFHAMRGPAPGFMLFASILAAIPLSLMLANLVLWVIPPLRRIHNEAFADAPKASFNDGMRQLATVAAFVLPLCLVAAAVGIVDPWQN